MEFSKTVNYCFISMERISPISNEKLSLTFDYYYPLNSKIIISITHRVLSRVYQIREYKYLGYNEFKRELELKLEEIKEGKFVINEEFLKGYFPELFEPAGMEKRRTL